MAIGSNAFLNKVASGITGNINKAYILLHRPENNPANTGNSGSDSASKSGLSKAAASLQSDIKNKSNRGRTLGVSGNPLNALGVDSSLMKKVNANEYFPLQVQFNPSSISFQGMAGDIRRESVGGSGENQFQQFGGMPTETVMAMELIFDDTNNKDAFMMDGEVPLLGDIASPGGLTQRIGQGVTALKGDTYSVQDQAELFVAAMVQSYTRWIGFAWNKTIFWGELVGVTVQYTMFNKEGAPIRAKVGIQIRQDQAGKDETPYWTEDEWENAFEKLFEMNAGNNAFGIANSDATNWLNGNFLNLG
ncbi:MAG: hypothetical protein IJ282_05810 [Lachnospiraceae bacterium]|nr:hypothetical protein [Lachnospiraceae bacterium]